MNIEDFGRFSDSLRGEEENRIKREDAESVYRDHEGDWYRDYEMLSDIARMTHWTEDELTESWCNTRREWAVSKLMEENE